MLAFGREREQVSHEDKPTWIIGHALLVINRNGRIWEKTQFDQKK